MLRLLILSVSLILFSFMAGCADTANQKTPQTTAEQKEEKQETSDSDSFKALIAAAEYAEDEGDDIAASAYWGSVIEADPFHRQALLGFARTARKSGISDRTIPYFHAFLRKYPQDEQAQFEFAKILINNAHYQPALDAIEAAEKINPNKWEYSSLKAIIYDRLERFTVSQDIYKQALTRFPNEITLVNNYALSLLLSNQIPQAKQAAEKLLTFEKLSPQIVENYARILFAAGEQNKAEEVTRQKLSPLQADRILLQLKAEFVQPQRWGTKTS